MLGADHLERTLSGIHHSGTSLACHLVNTWRILKGWECREPVCAAGLLHSAYGVLLPPTQSSRDLLRAKIGHEAEEIIFHLHLIPADVVHHGAKAGLPITATGIDGTDYPVDRALASGMVAIDLASTLEQLLRFDMDPGQMDRQRAVFAHSLYLLPPAGQETVARVWQLKGFDQANATSRMC